MEKLTQDEWDKKKRDKMFGYAIRLAAVVLLGIQPLYLKYTIASTIPAELRVVFIAAGAMLVSVLALMLLKMMGKQEFWKPKIIVNFPLVSIIITQALFWYLMNVSLASTASTHFALFNNFGPVFALVVALLLWRREIAYLQDRKNIMAIFAAFLVGGLGSSLLFYNTLQNSTMGSLQGDFIAVLAMVVDVILMTAQVRYARFLQEHQSLFLNFYASLAVFIVFSPLLFLKIDLIASFSVMQVVAILLAGVLSGAVQILNYEAFRRMDGFIALLMFNIAILITFGVEAFGLQEILPTPYLVIGGIMIVSASIVAEVINTRCERKQIEG